MHDNFFQATCKTNFNAYIRKDKEYQCEIKSSVLIRVHVFLNDLLNKPHYFDFFNGESEFYPNIHEYFYTYKETRIEKLKKLKYGMESN